MKKTSFTLFELLIVILLISILSLFIVPKTQINKLELGAKFIESSLQLTRTLAISDNRFRQNNHNWHKSRWTLKFMRCKSSVGGIYMVVYRDINQAGMPNKTESLQDMISKKYYYSANDCKEAIDKYPQILLTKTFDITNIEISCNKTDSLGQFSFGSFGEAYVKLSGDSYDFELKNNCFVNLYNSLGKKKTIQIAYNTGFVKIIE